jgi:hypothetical protein
MIIWHALRKNRPQFAEREPGTETAGFPETNDVSPDFRWNGIGSIYGYFNYYRKCGDRRDRDSRLYLDNILEAIHPIRTYVANRDEEAFATDRKARDAVIRNPEIIGEAADGRKRKTVQRNDHRLPSPVLGSCPHVARGNRHD